MSRNSTPAKNRAGATTSDNILRAATRLFAERGFDRVGMRDISEEVGVSLPSLYHHFGDKENLYRQVEIANYGAVEKRLKQAMSKQGSLEEQIKAFIAELYDLLCEDNSFRNLALRNMLDPDSGHHRFLVTSSLQTVFTPLEAMLLEYRPDADSKVLAFSIISGIFGIVIMAPAKEHIDDYPYGKRNRRRERDNMVEHLMRSVRAF